MSGRAGRRGLDKTGVVIINADSEVPDVRSRPQAIDLRSPGMLTPTRTELDLVAPASGPADQAAVAVPLDLLDDPQLAPRRGAPRGRNDQAQLLREFSSTVVA